VGSDPRRDLEAVAVPQLCAQLLHVLRHVAHLPARARAPAHQGHLLLQVLIY
jgi:hypothetical protein